VILRLDPEIVMRGLDPRIHPEKAALQEIDGFPGQAGNDEKHPAPVLLHSHPAPLA